MVVVVQLPSHVWLFATPWTAAQQASLSLTISQSLPKFMSIVLVMPSSNLILWCPLLLLPSIFPSIRDSSNESAVCIRWPKYWSFSFSINPSSEYSGLISLKIDWCDLLMVQGILRSLLQHHSLKASILWRSAFFMVQLSTTVHDHWEDHGLDYTDLYQQRDASASQMKLVVKSPSVSTGDIKDIYPWIQKIPLRRAWKSNPLFLPRESHGQRSQKVTKSQMWPRWLSTHMYV